MVKRKEKRTSTTLEECKFKSEKRNKLPGLIGEDGLRPDRLLGFEATSGFSGCYLMSIAADDDLHTHVQLASATLCTKKPFPLGFPTSPITLMPP